jgi:hypothetical protein
VDEVVLSHSYIRHFKYCCYRRCCWRNRWDMKSWEISMTVNSQ